MTEPLSPDAARAEADALRIRNPVLRRLLVAAGAVSFVLGLVGIPLPLLPTTPFVLLSAALWARSSDRLFVWLLTHPRLGPSLVAYRRTGAISRRAKALAVAMIVLSMGFSIAFVIPVLAGKVGVASIGVVVCTWLITRPSGPAEHQDPPT